MFDQTVLKEGLWKGRRCFVVGGGPSLKGFDWSRLKGELVIGTNRSFEQFEPSLLVTMDKRFYQWVMWGEYGEEVRDRYKGLLCEKVLVRNGRIDTDFFGNVTLVKRAGLQRIGLTFEQGISHGSNSGTCGIGLGILLGASEIYLLGFDMKDAKDGATHYHNGHPKAPSAGKGSHYERFIRYLEKLGPQMKEHAKIVNLNPESALEVFEKGSIDELPVGAERPEVICYYTDMPYKIEAESMARSARLFGLQVELGEVEDRGEWNRNAYAKAEYMLEKLREKRKPLVWIDADARIRQYPEWLDQWVAGDEDVGLAYVDWSKHPRISRKDEELISAVVALRPTEATFALLERWVEENKKFYGSRKYEQKTLQEIVPEMGVKVGRMPESYCQIFDSMASLGEPVIEQMQASRRAKRGLLNTSHGSSGRAKHVMVTGFAKAGGRVFANMLHYAYPKYKMVEGAMEGLDEEESTLSVRQDDLFDIVAIAKKAKETRKDLFVICLVRDIRDVMTSRTEGEYTVEFEGVQKMYRWMYLLGGMKTVSRVFLTYEQLVRDPDMVRELIASFLREEADRNWLKFWKDQKDLAVRNPERFDKHMGSLVNEWMGRWKDDAHRVRVLEEFGKNFELRKMLIELGYEENDQWYHVMADSYFLEREAMAL